jgi:lysophospholipid acyltransferase (LPLAT)-like uncharacterized protein
MKQKLLGFLIYLFYRAWFSTWRLTIIEPPRLKAAIANKKPSVFAFWHGDELVTTSLTRFYQVATMISTSKDGELMNQVVHRLGVKTSRGSSTRSGERALIGLIRLARQGLIPVIAVDGPKGPYHQVKPGVLEVAKRIGGPIFQAGIAASRKIIFKKAWNKACLPLPFSKVIVVWGAPLEAPAENEDSRSPELAKRLERQLDAAGQQAAKLIAKP